MPSIPSDTIAVLGRRIPRMSITNSAILNAFLTAQVGEPVVKWDVIELAGARALELEFVSTNATSRQGVWMQCDAGLIIGGASFKSVDLWEDTAPRLVKIEIPNGGKRLSVYNIWESEFGRNSQALSSGMLVEVSGSARIYRCFDVGRVPDFSRLVFKLTIS